MGMIDFNHNAMSFTEAG